MNALGFSLFGAPCCPGSPVLLGACLVTGQVGQVETEVIVFCSTRGPSFPRHRLHGFCPCWELWVREETAEATGEQAARWETWRHAPGQGPPTHVPGGCVRACPCLAAAASGAVPSASAAPAVTATCGPRHCCPRTPRTPGAHGPGEDQRQGPRGSLLSLLVHGRSLQPPAGEPGPAGAQVRTGERARAHWGRSGWAPLPRRARPAQLPEPSVWSPLPLTFKLPVMLFGGRQQFSVGPALLP